MESNKDIYKTSRLLYILEETFAYFISILTTGAYLAKVTSFLGASDTLTGILTAFTSLGSGFQLFAIFLANRRPVKRWVTVWSSISQLAFALIYLVPFIQLSQGVKIAIFVVLLLVANVVNNIVTSPRTNWYMSLIDDAKRGSFTASKEMVSLLTGIVFSFVMGTVSDHFNAIGNVKGAFVVCGLGIFGLMLLHSLTLIFALEKPAEEKEKISTKQLLPELVKDKKLFKVIMVSVLWNIVNCSAAPFYGSYEIKELGFSMSFVSILSAGYAITRSIVSKPLGKFADKHSFASMLNICYGVKLVGFVLNIFTVPENGKVLYTIYYMLSAVAMGGINSAAINLIYDYVDKEKRTSALALKNAMVGFAGFFTTLAVSPLVSYIQNNGNSFLGMHVYAQQVVSAIAAILLSILIVYLNVVVRKIKRA